MKEHLRNKFAVNTNSPHGRRWKSMRYIKPMIFKPVEDWIARAAIKWRNERRVREIEKIVDRVVRMNRDMGHGQDQKHKTRLLDE